MANIAALLKRIESGTLSYEEKLSALSQVEQSLQDMRQKKQEAIQSNVMLIVDALKQMQVKVEQQLEEAKAIVPQKGQKGDKGEKGERGLDGAPGKDGRNGIDGKDGKDGNDGISVTDAKIDFDGSLVITLSNGREINVGEVLPLEVSDKIKVIANGGGTSQTVVDTLTSLQNQINTLTGVDGVLGDMAQQNANNVAITGGAIDGATIGATTPAAGTFTTLTATGQTSLGGAAGSEGLRVLSVASTVNWVQVRGHITGNTPSIRSNGETNIGLGISSNGTGSISFYSNSLSNEQLRVAHTASAVNYVQVTGATTTARPAISAQGSDTNIGLTYNAKGGANHFFQSGGATSFAISNTASQVNYLQVSPSATNTSPVLAVLGSDTNISQVFQSKGTGAIDLAAGSSGVNISNGGTVTAITRTANGSGYTSVPTITVSAPTTAGGVQATVTANMFLNTVAVAGGGTGYSLNDVLTLSGGTSTQAAQVTVTAVSAGVITAVSIGPQFGFYSVVPTSPVSVTGGTGSGATFTVTWGYSGPTITNAGSGYVEQPTVSFSGGGGSGAAAYATVGSGTIVKSVGPTMSFYTPGGEGFRIVDNAQSNVNFWAARGSGTGASPSLTAYPTTAVAATVDNSQAASLNFRTNTNVTQLVVSHTASAVNYVQVTGAATGGAVQITTQGSDNNVGTIYGNKGVGTHSFRTGGTTSIQFQITNTTNAVNRLEVTGGVAGASPVLACLGADTNIDLTLTPKGTGNVRFGTYTGTALTIAGYIEIKDSGGTVRKLAVVA